MRLFTGISLPSDLAKSLERVAGQLRSTAALNWSPIEKLHITTKFIGEWPKEKLPELILQLQSIRHLAPEVDIAGFGYFPNPRRPSILFAAVHATPELKQLAATTDAAIVGIGGKREDHVYTPHVTLARISGQNVIALQERIAAWKSQHFGSFPCTSFHLYLSEASAYKILETFPLVKEAPVE